MKLRLFLHFLPVLVWKDKTEESFTATKPFSKAFIRDFKIRRLRTTTTVTHAIAHYQNHVTVHVFFSQKRF